MEIRRAIPGDEKGIAFVQVESWRTTYKGIIDDDHLYRMRAEDREDMWMNIIQKPMEKSFLYVACINQQIIGFCSGGPNRSGRFPYETELYAIYLLHEYQRRSIGTSLIRHLAQTQYDFGYRTMLAWVLKDNPSKAAYEKLGGIKLGEENIQIGEQLLTEEALGFDLAKLLQL
ncbi:GNAT family N-acetyltransferase [Fictibacillus terranigra]|uniref:GNAT family N-acetyltransferase n=1 Tax=Fictibacillus terranigra TaxID=3058424 RepID=A0ABT8E2X2_9BACL|nr:GNAT family N-acetyltransferase [Fictibacillus sp. CENA-BCM004]MDN4072254.1 GNAT family N-acetyltransferase [Fictibacillus sp. CENA-BCM004]